MESARYVPFKLNLRNCSAEDTTVYTIKGGAYVKVTLSFDIAQASG